MCIRDSQVHRVSADGFGDMDRAHRVDQLDDLIGVRDRLEVVERGGAAVHVQHLELGRGAGIADRDARHEAVPLRLGQRVGALHLHRVLRRDDHEGAGQFMGLPVHRHLALLHRLQQRRLGLGGGAVDFVADHDLGEDRAGLELELPALLVEDADPGDVGGQQIRGELDPPHRTVDGAGQRLGKHGLAHPRHVLDEQMALGQQHRQREPYDLRLALDHTLHRTVHPLHRGGQISQAHAVVVRRHSALPGPSPSTGHPRILAVRAASRHGLWITGGDMSGASGAFGAGGVSRLGRILTAGDRSPAAGPSSHRRRSPGHRPGAAGRARYAPAAWTAVRRRRGP